IAESAKASPEAIDGLVAALVGAVKQGADDAIDAAALLAALPVTSTRQAEASEAFAENLTPDQALIAQVRADIHWKAPHTDAVLERFKEVLTIKSPKRIGSIKGGRQGFLELWGVDSRWGDAVAG